VPPRDGDGISADGDRGLVAQIIPLRRRGQEPDSPQDLARKPQRQGVLDKMQGSSSGAQPSIWEQPTMQLRRRAGSDGAQFDDASASRVRLLLNRHLSVRVIVGIVAVALGAVGAAILVLGLGSPSSRPAHTVGRTFAHGANRPTSARVGIKKRTSRLPGRSTAATAKPRRPNIAHEGRARGSQSRRMVRSTPAGALTTVSGAGATPVQGHSSPTVDNSGGQTPSESTRGRSQAPSSSHAVAPSSSQSQCVPGELGC
jgi:hypothetical protein